MKGLPKNNTVVVESTSINQTNEPFTHDRTRDVEIARSIKSGDDLYVVDNYHDAGALNRLKIKTIHRNSLGYDLLKAVEINILVASHDFIGLAEAYSLLKWIERNGGKGHILDPYEGEYLPRRKGKTLGDFLAHLPDGSDEFYFWELDPMWSSLEQLNSEGESDDDDYEIRFPPIGWSLSRPKTLSDRFVWHQTIPRQGIGILAGEPGAGKTVLALNLAIRVSQGEEFLGRELTKGQVTYLAFQGNSYELDQQLLAAGADVETDDIFLRCFDDPMPSMEKALDMITGVVVTTRPRLLIVDMLESVVPGVDVDIETGYSSTMRALQRFSTVARAANTFILFLHHDNRAGRFLGSQGILGAVDVALQIKGAGTSPRYLQSVKVRIGDPLPRTRLALEDGRIVGGMDVARPGASPSVTASLRVRIETVLRQWSNGLTSKEVAAKVKKPNGPVREELREMVTGGNCYCQKDGRKSLYFIGDK